MDKTVFPDPQAFENLVREHQAGLRAFIRSLGADTAWVDDLAQEAFLVAYRRWGDLQEDADFGKWLRGIARKLTANERRKNARRARLLPFALTDLLWDRHNTESDFSPDTEAMWSTIQECVDRLPEKGRELLRRRYSESLKAGELARELCTSVIIKDKERSTLLVQSLEKEKN